MVLPAQEGPPFDTKFYQEVLPQRVARECQGRPGDIPVVNLYLSNGRMLDVCHIPHLADRWFAAQYFRDSETCADMDVAFVPYGLVTLVTVSLHNPASRKMGFNMPSGEEGTEQPADPKGASGV